MNKSRDLSLVSRRGPHEKVIGTETFAQNDNKFKCEVGFSDHTKGIGSSIAAVVKGASIIEKHMTLKRSRRGIDSEFSLEPNEMKALVNECYAAQDAIKNNAIGPTRQELSSLRYRRSLFISTDVKKGEKFSDSNIKSIRPDAGLHPRYLKDILGKVSYYIYFKNQRLCRELPKTNLR